ncbi:hypothetical protein CC1G_08316 [Coprinopsis cinerea okayama7|uniref:Uncharacterized protein n=1 Tax=Coprinopsis cinerea (strain Okayama-7 / 130 / ATCC MYA-4618 / FGSC 9003) TaxID=240176 RepID=A8NA56_COPC7|nr:hypothetical protein CC1G_08316 [Coprinopsis cinerea okayama7\|eukprot:XP_001831712.1 hypothetical protein CC1G_08316 [Coprinopsis cinerea okayama7\
MADHGHSHDHGGHTHGGQPCQGHGHGPQPQPAFPPVDPTAQALIDNDFVPVPLSLEQDATVAVCSAHKQEKCEPCNVDFVNMNRLSRVLASNPQLLCPPPSNVVNQKLSQMVTAAKDEGNVLFKSGQHAQALTRYTAAASLATQRAPWENNQILREELTPVMSNRSAAYYDLGDYISALADAEAVIQIRKNWPKGHFRKAKALLGLQKLKEAADAVKLGLSYEPNNQELVTFLADIERQQQKLEEKRLAAGRGGSKEDLPPDTPVTPSA